LSEDKALKLFVVLSRAYRTVAARAEKDIRNYGLNPTEFAVLELLYHKGEQPIQKIGERILLASGSMTYVIDKLEQKGYITRMPNARDRRVIKACITEQGARVIEHIFPSHRRALAEILAGVSDEEKDRLIELLKKVGYHARDL